ncbi:ATP-binding protein [Actinokineospora pegani]|uniref:ATP-binding protein n=1 Tax=Actinokineospora pegani TaxID=2654637 RepID=UPI001F4650E1|nr:ATP-binding protein [Actinokineospora pegani]
MDEQAIRLAPVVTKRDAHLGRAPVAVTGAWWQQACDPPRTVAVDGSAVSSGPGAAGARRSSTRLPAVEDSVGEAREFVGAALGAWSVPAALAGDIVLSVSELVTNAIEHGSGSVDVEVWALDGAVRLRVGDRSRGIPVRRQPSLLSERSRGLIIVEALSSAWGHEVLANDGKWVWADFALPADLPVSRTRAAAGPAEAQ